MNKKQFERRMFVLHKFDGDNRTWSDFGESELETWLTDGSIQEGDMVVYPSRLMEALDLAQKRKFLKRTSLLQPKEVK